MTQRRKHARRRDAAAIVESLYREYRSPLLAFCLNLTGGDRHWAEDVAQETMVRAWRRADELDPAAVSMMPWLATVARRIVIDDLRARNVRPQEVGQEPLEFVPGRDLIEPMLRRIVVTDAVRGLPRPQREAVVETMLRDRSVDDAARHLAVPVGTVKSRVHYAVRALRVSLAEPMAS
ncbi:sigma-70 family RNA polymerase sigma factor [Yinghuangia sp. YIM S09857]|uniref:sigma-70 family RNA polymerase sigma factor n=1 Tax=Yinghuangia sp. YIM S09857 TaxID=3436929 RepID=UPI003F52B0DC